MTTDMKQENTEFETMTNASTTTFREYTPPTTEDPDSFWSGRGAVPSPENTFQIIEKQSGKAIALQGDQPKLQSLRDTSHPDSHWLCVKQNGYFGFQNPQTGRYLGHDGKTGIRTWVFHLKDWELWTPRQHPEGGYELLSPYYSHTLMVLTARSEAMPRSGVSFEANANSTRRRASFIPSTQLGPEHAPVKNVNNALPFEMLPPNRLSPNSSIEYHWIDGVERLELYEPGGYHPVVVNDLLHNRYRRVDKLGFGGYSTIWLARDETQSRYVAVKIWISSPSLSRRELEVLKVLNGSGPSSQAAAVPTILDAFNVRGRNGTHPCYTVTPAQGNPREASFSRLFSVEVARALAEKLATAVAFVHSRGVVYGDIHLRNVLVKLPSTFDELSIPGFREKSGEAETVPISRVDDKPLTPNVPTNARVGEECNTPLAKKAPEALFEPHHHISYPSDIWSLGAAIWEILGMKFIFSESETLDEIVAQQINVLGSSNFPESWRKRWERLDGEDKADSNITIRRRPTGDPETWPDLEDAFEEFVQKYRRKREAAGTFEDARYACHSRIDARNA
ncbi:kinase-like protein [Diaporthe eres]|nr:kinase-like protein [Diaporthe eres]